MLKIISEIGINHNGEFKYIEELIRQSKLGGADYAKFQLYDSIKVFGDDSRKRNEFTFSQVERIKKICDLYEIEFFASVFDEEKLEWCLSLGVKNFKIASRTVISDRILCKKIIDTGLNTFVSLGFWEKESLPFSENNVQYFNCISNYPTSIQDIKNKCFKNYQDKIIGYSDHSYGISNCLYHIAKGATYIEKHFTLNKTMTGNDHIGSMNIEELKLLKEIGAEMSVIKRQIGEFE